MYRHVPVALLAVFIAPFAAACAGQDADEPPAQSKTIPDRPTRSAGQPILGAVSHDGLCDPSVVDIDHEKNTAYITYWGDPGDKVTLDILLYGGKVKNESFKLAPNQRGVHIPSGIYNGDIDRIQVHAEGTTGKPGSCMIAVN